VFYLRRERLEDVAPTGIGAYSGELCLLPGDIKYSAAASRHEYGTRNAGLVLGLLAAVQLQEEIGRARVAAYGRELATQLQSEFARIEGITLLTPRNDELRASVTTIRHPRAGAHKFFGYLLEKHRLRCRPGCVRRRRVQQTSLELFGFGDVRILENLRVHAHHIGDGVRIFRVERVGCGFAPPLRSIIIGNAHPPVAALRRRRRARDVELMPRLQRQDVEFESHCATC
jgi:selenocysteine lyase/cysteine desulfurase